MQNHRPGIMVPGALDHGALDHGALDHGPWCLGPWIMVPGALDHGAWCPGSWCLVPWIMDPGALDHGSWCLDPGAQIILDLVQRSPGALDHGSIWPLVPGSGSMLQYPEFWLHWILVPRIRDQSMYAKFLHTWSFCIPNFAYMVHGPRSMNHNIWYWISSHQPQHVVFWYILRSS